MNPLAYDSAYDPYHTAFRMLRLCLYPAAHSITPKKLRILDFYLNFPFLLKKFLTDKNYTLPKGGTGKLRQIDFDTIPEPYSDLPDSRTIFRQMEVFQDAAMQTLCVRGILDKNAFQEDRIQLVASSVPPDLLKAATDRNAAQESLVSFLMDFMASIELEGQKGLKARTHLLEHRYDAV